MRLLAQLALLAILAGTPAGLTFAQTASSGFNPANYPATRFQVTEEKHVLGDVTVKVMQIKKKTPDDQEPRYCRAWLEAWKGDNLFKRVDYSDIDPAGSSYGMFVPQQQPSSKYFIAVKAGDGDPRILLSSRDGDFSDLPGSFYFISADKRFLVAQTTAEGGSLSIFDFERGEAVLSGQEIPRIHTWHAGAKGNYFFTVAAPSTDMTHPVEERHYAYALDWTGAVNRIDVQPIEVMKAPSVSFDFRLGKAPDCTSKTPVTLAPQNAGGGPAPK